MPGSNDLRAGARAVSGRRLTRLGREIAPKATWQQLILPDDSIQQLRELCSTVRTRSQVPEEWGFASKLTGGRGVTALFAGISGTGKTMAAEVIANELGLPLFRIELAGVVSKYIGETEKNLDRVFEAATDSNAILFFDEADALFGKRTEVKDSHDRYANLEMSYLLQKMESYEGAAILATNMRQQIDDAFLPRLKFTVIFPLPDAGDRLRIWEAVWPSELPRGADVDLERMARLKFTGGNIKNIILAAAHSAAAAQGAVGMPDLVLAVRSEYQKLGKQIDAGEVHTQLGV
jgi:SpoVK/Ycf46/Vps4 family AAA+-type ATPase